MPRPTSAPMGATMRARGTGGSGGADGDCVAVLDDVGVLVAVFEDVCVCVGVCDADRVDEGVGGEVGDCVGVSDGLGVIEAVFDGVGVPVCDGEPVCVLLGVGVRVIVDVCVTVCDSDGTTVDGGVGSVGVCDEVGDGVRVCVLLGVLVRVPVPVLEFEAVFEGDAPAVFVIAGVGASDCDRLCVTGAVTEGVDDWLFVGVADGDRVCDAVFDGV